MRFTTPRPADSFTITSAPAWPTIVFETDATGPHKWAWTLEWGSFREAGTETSPRNTWNAAPAIVDRGGLLTVRAEAGGASASISVVITGTNPSPDEVVAYLATRPNSAGFDAILRHESKFKHFDRKGEPLKSFDKGYGMSQLTTPPPAFDQVWNWKRNIDGGLKLFAQKHAAALRYLSQKNRTFTPDQLRREAVCRWNGGAYHEWDPAANAWVRTRSVLCDKKTGNIGWDMNDPANKGKTEAELHKRDSPSYSRPPNASSHWRYFGICYADRILD